MWDDVEKHLVDFSTAVLTGVDSSGYPVSVRCKPKSESIARVVHVQVPDGTDIQPGPASLLCHKHDELMWDAKSFLVRGVLEHDAHGWILRPLRFIPGMGIGRFFLMDMLRMTRNGRRTTKRYLERRNLPRPRIPWDEINAKWAQSKESQ